MIGNRWWIVIAFLFGGIGVADSADVVVVCPSQFQLAVQPWLTHRRAEGLEVCLIAPSPKANDLRVSIREAANERTRYVLLIGDAPVIGTPCNELRQTPMLYAPTSVTSAWGSTPTLATDLFYGDFDSDQVPEAVVGRLPVDTPDQLSHLIDRIIARDNSDDFGSWRSQVQLVGGVGGFGAMADSAIESVTRTIVTGVLPVETRTHICYASPGHAFFPNGQPFTDAVIHRYQQGSRFWVYAGHGQVTHLDRVPNTLNGIPVLDRASVQRLSRPASAAPIALMLACYTGALDAAEDSIAEEMILAPGGPIAVLAGSRITMPYGNTTAAVGLIDGVFQQELPRLGDAWKNALLEMNRETTKDTSTARIMIDALAAIISPAGTKLVDERREHMMLYNLIGDPTLRLHHPKRVSIRIETGYAVGESIALSVESPIDGQLTLCLDRPLGSVTTGDANNTTVATIESEVAVGQVCERLVRLPSDFSGPLIVRATVSGNRQWATASARTIVRK